MRKLPEEHTAYKSALLPYTGAKKVGDRAFVSPLHIHKFPVKPAPALKP